MNQPQGASTRRRSVRQRIAFGVLATVLSALVALTALEIALRVTRSGDWASTLQEVLMADPATGYRPRPGAQMRYATREFATDIRINSVGVRDEEIGTKAPNERRILVLGDSMVMAVQVPLEQTFVKRLEQRLNAQAGGTGTYYRVINAGVQGYGPVEEYSFFMRIAPAIRPDLVLLVVYVGNDALDAAASAWRLDQVAPARAAHAAVWEAVRRLSRRSAAIQFFRQGLANLRWQTGQVPARDALMDAYLADPPSTVKRGFEVARTCLERLKLAASARKARTAVVLLPARFQFDSEEFARLADLASGAVRAHYVRDGASEHFRAALAPVGVPLCDLLPVFRSRRDVSAFYFHYNAHLTSLGHEVVAEALARFLSEAGLVGVAPAN